MQIENELCYGTNCSPPLECDVEMLICLSFALQTEARDKRIPTSLHCNPLILKSILAVPVCSRIAILRLNLITS